MSNNVKRFPVTSDQRRKNKLGPRAVPCVVSSRWLQFAEQGVSVVRDKEFICLDVMTEGSDDEPHKLCELIIDRKDLLNSLNNVTKPSGEDIE
jgi:hypothetical protein